MHNEKKIRSASQNVKIGDKVLALLPVLGSTLSTKFAGPYEVRDRLSETDYVISTPERQKKTRVCHVNMLKAYNTRDSTPIGTALVAPAEFLHATRTSRTYRFPVSPFAEFGNVTRPALLIRTSTSTHRQALLTLVAKFPKLFGDTPSKTTLINHDIDVNGARPIRVFIKTRFCPPELKPLEFSVSGRFKTRRNA